MQPNIAEVDWKSVMESTGPYPPDAYHFVREGLNWTSKQVYADPEGLSDIDRHLSGQQLCMGLRDFAIDRFGFLAPTVLQSWSIGRTDDFGRIVYALIDLGVMSRTPDDSVEDFRAVYDFSEAFHRQALVEHIEAT